MGFGEFALGQSRLGFGSVGLLLGAEQTLFLVGRLLAENLTPGLDVLFALGGSVLGS